MFVLGQNKSRTFLQSSDPVGRINPASLHSRGKSKGYSEKVRDKKKTLLVFLFVFSVVGGVFFLFDVQPAYAANGDNNCLGSGTGKWFSGFGDCVGKNFGTSVSEVGEAVLAPIEWAFKWLLYGIFIFFGWLASVALTLFEWAIDPKYISGDPGLFNRQSIYDMWKFIRDFFNLFFILVLLYIAFTVVFQIQKDFKKALLSLVLAALFINFSFPITRFLIDATNVPMYFFANQMAGGKSLGTVMSASDIKGILVPGSEKDGNFDTGKVTVSRLIAAIVFIFIFSITLLVLAIMFVIRLIALLILLVFSSAGFAASIIPGMEQYSKMWWENFWKYALFGPAAMLMILIATRFFGEIGNEQSAVLVGLRNTATGVTTQTEASFIASMAMFSIPIIMLWMAMGLAQKMSIAGAASVTGYGQKFAKWAGRKAAYDNPFGRGLTGAAKKIGKEGKFLGMDYGSTRLGKFATGKYWAAPSKTEATIKGGIVGGWGGGAKERVKAHQQAVNARVKEDKENQVSNSVHRKNLKDSKNLVEREAAALALAADKEIRTTDELSQALDALKNNSDGLLRAIDGTKPEAIAKIGSAAYATMRDIHYEKDKNGVFVLDTNGNRVVREGMERPLEALNDRTRKEGNIKVKVDYEIAQKGSKSSDVYKNNFDKMGAEDIAKQENIHSDPAFHEYVQKNMSPKRMQGVMQKVIEKSGNEAQKEWTKILSGAKIEVESPKIVVEEGYRTRPRT